MIRKLLLFLTALIFPMQKSNAIDIKPVSEDAAIPVNVIQAETDIPENVIQIALDYGKSLKRLHGMSDDGDEYPANGFTVEVPSKNSVNIVQAISGKIGDGYIVFISDSSFGGKPDTLAVLKSKDQFEALKTMGTNGWNYDISPEQVIKKLQEWDAKYGLIVTGAGFDWTQASFKNKPESMLDFAKEVYEFCPDVVDQGTETVEALAKEMDANNNVYLWWD